MPVGPLRAFGKRHIELLSAWAPTAATFGATSGVALLYFTDWQLVLQYVPFINGKFKADKWYVVDVPM